jgi:hypothetical protein
MEPVSLPFETFLEHVAAAQQRGVFPSHRNIAAPVLVPLTTMEEQHLLKLFATASKSSSATFEDVERMMAAVLNISIPTSADILNKAVGFGKQVACYTWDDVLRIARAAKGHARNPNNTNDKADTTVDGRVRSSADAWADITEQLFFLLTEDDNTPTVATTKALEFLVSLVFKQKRRALCHAEAVRLMVPESMTFEEFEKHIVVPLRAFLLREPKPNGPAALSSGGSRDIASVGFFALSELLDKRKDTSMLFSSIASLSERQRKARRLRSWVVAHPKSYFNIPPCVMRSTGLYHIQGLKHTRLRNFVSRMKADVLKSSTKLRKWQLAVVRCVERAEEIILRHADRCDRCAWLGDKFGSPLLESSRSFSSFRKVPTPPSPKNGTMIPTIDVDAIKPFTPRINKAPSATRSPRKPSKPLVVNESLMVSRIFDRARESSLL